MIPVTELRFKLRVRGNSKIQAFFLIIWKNKQGFFLYIFEAFPSKNNEHLDREK